MTQTLRFDIFLCNLVIFANFSCSFGDNVLPLQRIFPLKLTFITMKRDFSCISRILAFTALLLSLSVSSLQAASRHDFHVTFHRAAGQSDASVCAVHSTVLGSLLNVADLSSDLGTTVKLYAVKSNGGLQGGGSLIHYFDTTGAPASRAKGVVSSQFDKDSEAFHLQVLSNSLTLGDNLSYTQAFVNINTADTVYYHFLVNIDGHRGVESDEPTFFHRADKMDSWQVQPYLRQNEQEPVTDINILQVNAGDKVTIGVRPLTDEDEVSSFNVKHPSGRVVKSYSSKDYEVTVGTDDAGEFQLTVRYKRAGRKYTSTYSVYLDVQTAQGQLFDWTENTPHWSYNFRDDKPEGYPVPTKTHRFTQHSGKAANRYDGDWWCVYWGDNLNSECGTGNVLQNEMKNMVNKFDEDFAYIRDVMGWPPDINARRGYKSFVYVFGSGINRDNTSNTEQGGYQGYTEADDGGSWPCVWASYYPVSRFRDDADNLWGDGDYQREAMVHEGIHATFADMEGVKQSAWFHEGGNVWLQMAMNAKRDGTYGAPGWLGVGNLICPFMPIECYSGWLQDGSFGGPSAEGVNMYQNGKQVCTWRNLIGGVQYGEVFPLFLGEIVGEGSVPWIWRYCKTRVLEGIALGNSSEGVAGIGDEAMRMLIMQYRARLATLDFGGFSEGCRSLLNGSFLTTVKAEWEPYWIDVAPFRLTPYQTCKQNDADGWLAPDTITNPGWSGGNIIPVHVVGNGCRIDFRPEDSQMRAQLCYRTKDGRTFYSQPVRCGQMLLSWDEDSRPANDVVFCVVCNTDYIYVDDSTRKKHFDYRIRLGEGATAVASPEVKWYFYEQNFTDPTYTAVESVGESRREDSSDLGIRILSSVLKAGQRVQLDLNGVPASEVQAHLVGCTGVLISSQTVSPDGSVQLPAFLPRGLYVLSLLHKGKIQSFKTYAE